MDGDSVLTPAEAQARQVQMSKIGELVVWVVYAKPIDYPGQYVARPGLTGGMLPLIMLADTLDELRAKLPSGLTRIERHPEDDPAVAEVWV